MRGSKSWRAASVPFLVLPMIRFVLQNQRTQSRLLHHDRGYMLRRASRWYIVGFLLRMEAVAGEKAHTEGTGLLLHSKLLPGSLHAWFKKSEGCLYALLVFPMVRFVLQNQRRRSRLLHHDEGYNVEMSNEVVRRWLFAPHGGGRRRKAHKLPGSLHAWFKRLEGCLYALLALPMIRFVLQDQ